MNRFYASTAVARLQAFDTTPTTRAALPANALETIKTIIERTNDEGNRGLAKRADDSAAMLPYWCQVDDLIKGKEAVVAQGDKYLKRFPEEDNDTYAFRLKNTKFTNVYRDIVETLASKPFEQEIQLVEYEGEGEKQEKKAPDEIKSFCEDVDGAGNNLTVFAGASFFKAINDAVAWIMVDYENFGTNIPANRAEEKAAGARPSWSHVLARNVLEAKSAKIAGKYEWIYIRVYEPGEPNKIRVMIRDGVGARWELYREVKDKNNPERNTWVIEDQGVYTIGVIPMVMYATGRRDGNRYFFYPAMQDASDLQIELYEQESDLKFSKRLTAFPMVSAAGVKPEMDANNKPKTLPIGPGRTLYAPPDGDGNHGEFKFIEITAQSLNFLQSEIKVTTDGLRELGRQPLTAQSGNLTVITTAVAAGKAKTAVGAWALNMKDALENALRLTCLWLAVKTYEPEIRVFDEYDDFEDPNADLTALSTARTAKDISRRTYWSELQRRGTLSADFNPDTEEELLLEELPGDEELDENGNVVNPKKPVKPGATKPSNNGVK